jgi:hypothetical protein
LQERTNPSAAVSNEYHTNSLWIEPGSLTLRLLCFVDNRLIDGIASFSALRECYTTSAGLLRNITFCSKLCKSKATRVTGRGAP